MAFLISSLRFVDVGMAMEGLQNQTTTSYEVRYRIKVLANRTGVQNTLSLYILKVYI